MLKVEKKCQHCSTKGLLSEFRGIHREIRDLHDTQPVLGDHQCRWFESMGITPTIYPEYGMILSIIQHRPPNYLYWKGGNGLYIPATFYPGCTLYPDNDLR